MNAASELTMESRQSTIIALVEDERMDVRHFKRLVKKHELSNPLEVFENAETALAFLRSAKYTSAAPVLVVTDINMPGMSGHEFIEEIRQDPDLASTVVFVVSTSDLESDIQRAYDSRIAGYIVKDATGAALDESVRMLRHYCGAVTLAR